MYHDISDLLKGGVREWTFCGVLSKEEIERLGSAASASRAQAILDRCAELGYSVLTIDDPAYPHCLMHLYAPPAVAPRATVSPIPTNSPMRSPSMRPLSSAAALSA